MFLFSDCAGILIKKTLKTRATNQILNISSLSNADLQVLITWSLVNHENQQGETEKPNE